MFRLLIIIIILIANSSSAEDKSPNFLVIVTDDQNTETVSSKWMPNTKQAIFDQGLAYQQAFIL